MLAICSDRSQHPPLGWLQRGVAWLAFVAAGRTAGPRSLRSTHSPRPRRNETPIGGPGDFAAIGEPQESPVRETLRAARLHGSRSARPGVAPDTSVKSLTPCPYMDLLAATIDALGGAASRHPSMVVRPAHRAPSRSPNRSLGAYPRLHSTRPGRARLNRSNPGCRTRAIAAGSSPWNSGRLREPAVWCASSTSADSDLGASRKAAGTSCIACRSRLCTRPFGSWQSRWNLLCLGRRRADKRACIVLAAMQT